MKTLVISALSGTSKWDKKHFTGLHELSLKWFVSEYTNDIPKAIIRYDYSVCNPLSECRLNTEFCRSTIQKAFQLWAKQANERNLPKVRNYCCSLTYDRRGVRVDDGQLMAVLNGALRRRTGQRPAMMQSLYDAIVNNLLTF